jgi:hypothetical protein
MAAKKKPVAKSPAKVTKSAKLAQKTASPKLKLSSARNSNAANQAKPSAKKPVVIAKAAAQVKPAAPAKLSTPAKLSVPAKPAVSAKLSAPKKQDAIPDISLGRPLVTQEEKLYMLFKEDYHARQIFEFLRVQTVKELEQFSPSQIVRILSKPLTNTVERIRQRLAEMKRSLREDETFAADFLHATKQPTQASAPERKN